MIRRTLAVLVVGIFAMMGLVASASAEDWGDCRGYTQDECKPSYPPKPPQKPDKPECDRDHGWCEPDKPSRPDHPTSNDTSSTGTSTSTTTSTTTTSASTRLAQTGANDNTVLLLAVGGGLVLIGGAAFAVSRLRRQT